MTKELGILLAMALSMGCGDNDVQFDPSEQGNSARVSSETPPPAPDQPVDRGEEVADPQVFTYKLPPGQNAATISGLEIVTQSDSERVAEGYRAQVFALAPAGPDNRVNKLPLGGQDIFRPLGKGEETSIFIDHLSDKAWIKKDGGYEIKLGVEIAPAHQGRKKPNVSLRIIEVKPERE